MAEAAQMNNQDQQQTATPASEEASPQVVPVPEAAASAAATSTVETGKVESQPQKTKSTQATPSGDFDPAPIVANTLSLPLKNVRAVIALLQDDCTVPFIARYRKEVTGSLDEVAVRDIQEQFGYSRDLHQRRLAILKSIEQQGKLTPELRSKLEACSTKQALEDLYLPYKPKRRTRGAKAIEAGLEPLAELILAQPVGGDVAAPAAEAAQYINSEHNIGDADAALAGARDIVAERLAENADTRAQTRTLYEKHAQLVATVVPDKSEERTKFEQYYDFSEAVKDVPSHRFLAIRRGEREGVLRVRMEVDGTTVKHSMAQRAGLNDASPYAAALQAAIDDSFVRLIGPSVETDTRVDLKMKADRGAVQVFADNLRHLLLAAPLGQRGVVGIDPGLRTGCKCVALSPTGTFLEHQTIYPSKGSEARAKAADSLLALVKKHQPYAVAVGNGTGGRETEAFAREVLKMEGAPSDVVVVSVNESGASVYSASDVAREEFPKLDLTVRGAISIGRRLQDPLAELVKIEPKSIGVGQYQHDVHQPLLQRQLGEVVESCVNHVGVELNTASAALLTRVAGLGPSLAKKIVAHRDSHGPFANRDSVKNVAGLGPRAFEQAAGFLRVRGKDAHPLDASAVHPERYTLVRRMADDLNLPLTDLVGNSQAAKSIKLQSYVDEAGGVGEPTLRDIVAELVKPGRDPRDRFDPPKFRDDVSSLEQLTSGMALEGVVTNVTAFGAFVDVGVHQDGLVHVSQLSTRFVKDPATVVKVGDKLKVWVLDVDVPRKRISLTAKDPAAAQQAGGTAGASGAGAGASGSQKAGGHRDGRGGRGGRSERGGRGGRSEPTSAAARGDKSGGKDRSHRGPRPGGRGDGHSGGSRGRSGGGQKGSGFSHNPFADLLNK